LSSELTLVIPTFNEHENIPVLVNRLEAVLQGYKWEVIFVDDDSPDGTANVVRDIAADNPRVRCIQRLRRRGLASACIEGILASSSPFVAVMDADMQHDESILPEMLKTIQEDQIDLVIGSRYASGGSTGELAPFRVWISCQATKLSRLVLRYPIADPMSGFFMLRRTFFEQIMRKLSGKGFKILLDIIISAGKDIKIRELPYTMRKRIRGESKLDARVIWEFFTLVAHKLSGRLVPYQFLSFAAVGFTGIFVHLVTLWFTHKYLSMEFLYSQIIATLMAMTSNYFLNNEFTFKENKLRGLQWIYGLLSFYVACSLGAVINVAVADLLFERSIPWWLAGTAGAIAGAVWNYAITATYTWKSDLNSSN
jgi:dolichol-phosphate mannosyltransferase